MTIKAQFPDEQSIEGTFQRQEDAFRGWVSADGSSPYRAEAGRYHLYVSLACPWASRIVIVRKLKGLGERDRDDGRRSYPRRAGLAFHAQRSRSSQRLGILERSLFCQRSRLIERGSRFPCFGIMIANAS